MNPVANTLTPGFNAFAGSDSVNALIEHLSYRELMDLQHRVLQQLSEHRAKSAEKAQSDSCAGLIGLTRREAEVLTLVANGYTRREVGEALSITSNTAATHISTIYRKLDVSSIAEATALAIRWGLVS